MILSTYSNNRLKKRSFTLVEVIIALFCISIGLISIIYAYSTMLSAFSSAQKSMDFLTKARKYVSIIEEAAIQGKDLANCDFSLQGQDLTCKINHGPGKELYTIEIGSIDQREKKRERLVTYLRVEKKS